MLMKGLKFLVFFVSLLFRSLLYPGCLFRELLGITSDCVDGKEELLISV